MAELVREQINDLSVSYPKLEVINGMVRVYIKPDSNSSYVSIPPGTHLIATETHPSRNSSAIMALVEGEYCNINGECYTVKGWVSLSSNNLTII